MSEPSAPVDDDAGAIAATWHGELEWAERGDFRGLAQALRSELPLLDDYHVRNFLADVLVGKFKRPKGRQVRRKDWTFALVAGNVRVVDAPPAKTEEIRRWVREKKDVFGVDVVAKAAVEFNVVEATVENAMKRSATAWTKPRSK